MPLPVTPSPHRFVIKKQPPPPRSQLAQESTPRPAGSQQFNATPRFTFSSTPRPTGTQGIIPSSTPAGRYLTPARQTLKARESIDDLSDDYPANLPFHDSIDTHDEFDTSIPFSTEGAEDDDVDEIDTCSFKRRRISTSLAADIALAEDDELENDLLSSSIPIVSSPITQRANPTPSTNSKPKFLLSTPLPPSTPQSTASTPFLKPPRFRPPDPAETQGNIDPLPEQFSPHRRGQKYVAGGLAAEVRDWLINIDSSIPSHGTGVQRAKDKNKDKDSEWVVKMVIDEVSAGGGMGMCLVRGRQLRVLDGDEVVDDMGMVKVMLAGEGAGTGLQRGRDVEIGRVVGIKRPVWEVVVEGEKWGVGVDWKVL
ncbi:hypothetical protein SBOR_3126 [Sclerotinia borealis F-4128]|uniref:Uncharacterized protein n=1 Tax=Sclerotinia borealis (strain F-4128) TaxID=1432307 RepID=W9CPE8_SCLBF|nr:hypothetical protein SBOR_3126 [Sclerotinia borealis F-4128]